MSSKSKQKKQMRPFLELSATSVNEVQTSDDLEFTYDYKFTGLINRNVIPIILRHIADEIAANCDIPNLG